MKNSIKLLYLLFRTKLLQLFNLSIALIKGQISYYPMPVKIFERKFAGFHNAKNAILFSNATSAMEAALFSLGIKSGSRVGTVGFVIPSSYCPAFNLGADLEFIDVSAQTLNIDPDNLVENQNLNLDCLIIIHFFGNPCDMVKISKWAKDNNVRIIEDCSHAHGASIENKLVGTWGEIGVFSLQGAKSIAAGEGGVAITNNDEVAIRMAAYGHQKSYKNFNFYDRSLNLNLPPFGYGKKMRIHPLGAVLALIDLKYLNIKNKIYENWVLEIERISSKTNKFSLPKNIDGAKRGGYCQSLAIIFSNSNLALQFLDDSKAKSIGTYLRNYEDDLEYYGDQSDSEKKYINLKNSIDLFGRVVFIPFYQFIDFRRWRNLNKILIRYCNEQ